MAIESPGKTTMTHPSEIPPGDFGPPLQKIEMPKNVVHMDSVRSGKQAQSILDKASIAIKRWIKMLGKEA